VRRLFLFLLPCLLHGLPGSLEAQSPELPGWVVPVLRLVSTTHVEPTTGVVLSADGLVLVPADFASPGDEIIVLDGGTDIVRDGRPAHLENAFPELGLEVLRVTGLHRRGAPLAPTDPGDGSRVRLRAFPPAEQIAEGAAPLDVAATIASLPESDTPSFAADSKLPNVTGALLDECGNLVGLSLADGVQSLSTDAATRYRWTSALRGVFANLQLAETGKPCSVAAVEAASPPPADEEAAAAEPLQEPSAVEARAPETEPAPPPVEAAAAAEAIEEQATEAIEEPEQRTDEPPLAEEATGTEGMTPGTGATGRSRWWVVAALVLLAGGFLAYRLRRRRSRTPVARFGTGAAEVTAGMAGSAAGAETEPGWLQVPTDRLLLRGFLGDGRPFEASAAVCADAINLEIGRGNADLSIDSASVSRRHARLNGTGNALTLTDLGSNNGSSINGVPCLEGEIMYVEPGDTVILGDARFTVTIAVAGAGGRHE